MSIVRHSDRHSSPASQLQNEPRYLAQDCLTSGNFLQGTYLGSPGWSFEAVSYESTSAGNIPRQISRPTLPTRGSTQSALSIAPPVPPKNSEEEMESQSNVTRYSTTLASQLENARKELSEWRQKYHALNQEKENEINDLKRKYARLEREYTIERSTLSFVHRESMQDLDARIEDLLTTNEVLRRQLQELGVEPATALPREIKLEESREFLEESGSEKCTRYFIEREYSKAIHGGRIYSEERAQYLNSIQNTVEELTALLDTEMHQIQSISHSQNLDFQLASNISVAEACLKSPPPPPPHRTSSTRPERSPSSASSSSTSTLFSTPPTSPYITLGEKQPIVGYTYVDNAEMYM
ncbi:uncharacterized protein VTP21DRAFT_123 [Calcarisporiella thermophila]|uniref:uncharacterized protein n=1 Tax=Calcarisporiella thermophila TaxID=911321 RepID=UPI0037439B79